MYKIKDIVEKTGLKDSFVRRCVREMQDIFDPYVERGSKNSFIFDSKVIPIFKKIEQDKDNGLSLLSIKKNLLNNSDILSENDLKTDQKTTEQHSYDEDEWLSIKDAAKLSKRSESTIKRVIVSEFKHDHSRLKKDESSKRGTWLINKKFLLNHFSINPGHKPVYDPNRNIDYDIDQNKGNIGHGIVYNQGRPVNHQESQVVELLEKQISELKGQLKQKDTQLEKQASDFKSQIEKQAADFKELLSKKDEHLNQKDQQIHQLHVLLKESKTSTIDYKPDDSLGVFSKVLVKFGL